MKRLCVILSIFALVATANARINLEYVPDVTSANPSMAAGGGMG